MPQLVFYHGNYKGFKINLLFFSKRRFVALFVLLQATQKYICVLNVCIGVFDIFLYPEEVEIKSRNFPY